MHHQFFWLFFSLFAIQAGLLAQNKPVKTANGLVSGLQNGVVRSYLGIPFAAPPVGDLRWKAPQAVQNWKGIRACTKFSASPIQNKPAPFSMWTEEFIAPPEPLSEDCLYLNVWTAAKSAKEKRPVLVWIYGGGFVSGSSACAVYDGDALAQKGVVYVSINYRVGALGFMAHPELTKESGYNASGNYAFLDQIAALKWVKQNIAAFGGDPNNVTIAGQSAGSFSINALIASPLAKGYSIERLLRVVVCSIAPDPDLWPMLKKLESYLQKMQESTASLNCAKNHQKKSSKFQRPFPGAVFLQSMMVTFYPLTFSLIFGLENKTKSQS